ncbi:hypothetical protein V8G54_029527 [Vigna mungo]|uniref:Uncharacterized protein n=1 Tax=Vigna mungo TaxID=3915 RepID=A0AAQ3RKE4_VIGMU
MRMGEKCPEGGIGSPVSGRSFHFGRGHFHARVRVEREREKKKTPWCHRRLDVIGKVHTDDVEVEGEVHTRHDRYGARKICPLSIFSPFVRTYNSQGDIMRLKFSKNAIRPWASSIAQKAAVATLGL